MPRRSSSHFVPVSLQIAHISLQLAETAPLSADVASAPRRRELSSEELGQKILPREARDAVEEEATGLDQT